MKNAFRFLLGVFVVGVTMAAIAAAVGAGYFAYRYEKPSDLVQNQTIHIPSGTGVSAIANILVQAGVLQDDHIDRYVFQIGARVNEQAQSLKAGEYEIPAGSSIEDILFQLEEGKVVQRQVTVREGLTSYQVLLLLSGVDDLGEADGKVPAEGSLLPETYSYSKGQNVEQMVSLMQSMMVQTIDELWDRRASDLPITTKEEAVILASIVEKETGAPGERRKVAGVFINRLRIGMPLQTDPTVIYALTKGRHKNNGKGPLGRRLLRKDLEYDSPYNTYLYKGLPPGPIANPGRASLEAVLNPEAHSYLYFVADGTGGHAFAKTLDGHNRNVSKWRKIRKNQSK